MASLAVLVGLVALPLYPKIDLVSVGGTYIGIRLDDIIIAIVVGFWLLSLAVERRRPEVPRHIALAVGTWLAIGLVALLFGAIVLRSIPVSTGVVYWAKPIEYVLLGLVVYDLLRVGALSLRAVMLVIGGAAAIVVGYGLLERFGLVPHLPGTVVPPGGVISTIGDLHQLAAYLGIGALTMVAVWHRLPSRAARAAALVGLAALAILMLATGARSEYLALGLCLAVLLRWRPARLPAAVTAAAMVLLFALPILTNALPRLAPTPSGPAPAGPTSPPPPVSVTSRLLGAAFDYSLNERMGKWRNFIAQGMRSPVIGLGPSAATEAADGYYIRVFVESGVLGLAAFLALIVTVLATLWKGIRRSTGTARALAVGVLAATAFVSLVSILIDTWVASRVMELYWPLLGAALAAVTLQVSRSLPAVETSREA